MKIVPLFVVMTVVVTVTESAPFFGFYPFRSIICDLMCQYPYNDSFCAFCNRTPPGRNTAQSAARASSNGNSNVNAQSSANVGGGPIRVTPTTTTTTTSTIAAPTLAPAAPAATK